MREEEFPHSSAGFSRRIRLPGTNAGRCILDTALGRDIDLGGLWLISNTAKTYDSDEGGDRDGGDDVASGEG